MPEEGGSGEVLTQPGDGVQLFQDHDTIWDPWPTWMTHASRAASLGEACFFGQVSG